VRGISVVILLGAPGVGKGTVAQYLKDKYNAYHFSTGNLLRNEVEKGSDIGNKVEDTLRSGGLVGDEIVNELVKQNIEKVVSDGSVVVLDGYPRTKNQAIVLDDMLSGKLKEVIRVIEIDVDKECLVARLSKRRVCIKCGNTFGPQDGVTICSCGGKLIKRKDDEESVIRNRLKKYEEDTLPVSRYYADRLVNVSGDGSPVDVVRRVDVILHSLGIEKRR
jgi:adenylate kinase